MWQFPCIALPPLLIHEPVSMEIHGSIDVMDNVVHIVFCNIDFMVTLNRFVSIKSEKILALVCCVDNSFCVVQLPKI
jgi:hypothetical protein